MDFVTRQGMIEEARKRRDGIMQVAAPDYAQMEADVNANFTRVGNALKRVYEGPRDAKYKAFATYMFKHLDAVLGWLAGQEQQKENIHGRIDDLLNYLEMLDSMIADDENASSAWAPISKHFRDNLP